MYYVIVLFYIRIIFIKNEINITEIDKQFESQFQSSHLKTVSVLLINKNDVLLKKYMENSKSNQTLHLI